MKDSGVSWIGRIPTHWTVTRVGDIAKIVNGYPFDSGLFHPTDGMPLVRIRDIDRSQTEILYAGPPVAAALIAPREIIIGMDGDFNLAQWAGPTALLNQRLCVVRAKSATLERFLYYALPTPLKIINDVTYSTTVKHLSSADIKQIRIPAPPDAETSKIVAFLDRETAEADALIAKYERLIELLEEKRIAVITQAVTKGLDASVPMRDSGIQWIGKVPAHWKALPIRRVSLRIETGQTPDPSELSDSGDVPWYTPGDFLADDIEIGNAQKYVQSGTTGGRVYPADSVLTIGIGATLGKVALPKKICSSNQQINAIFPNRGILPKFLAYCLKAQEPVLRMVAASSTLAILNQSRLGSVIIAAPPIDEQQNIVDFVDRYIRDIKPIRGRIGHAISLTKERRSALISAAVTGQIDVSSYKSRRTPESVA
jgi:type I restriction enzyme S subunit